MAWTCVKCGKRVGDSLDLCWNCGASAKPDPSASPPATAEPQAETDLVPPGSGAQESPGSAEPPSGSEEQVLAWLKEAQQDAGATVRRDWVCPQCQETIPWSFEVCWNCQAVRPDVPGVKPAAEGGAESAQVDQSARDELEGSAPGKKRRVGFRYFRSLSRSWEDLFQEATDFANSLGADRVISISHSADQCEGVVTVWFWE